MNISEAKNVDEVREAANLLSQMLKQKSTTASSNDSSTTSPPAFSKASPCGEKDACSGNGECINSAKCVCKPGFSGALCQFKSEDLSAVSQMASQVSSQLAKMVDLKNMTEEKAQQAVETVLSLSTVPDALSGRVVKDLVGLLTNMQLASGNSTDNVGEAMMNSFDNLLSTVNNYGLNLTSEEKIELVTKSLNGFSKALESEVEKNKLLILQGETVNITTTNVLVTLEAKTSSSNNSAQTVRRLLAAESPKTNISSETVEEVNRIAQGTVIMQIEYWAENPRNKLDPQEISTDCVSISARRATDLEFLEIQNLKNPVSVRLNRNFGFATQNDTCFLWNSKNFKWETEGAILVESTDAHITCQLSRLSQVGGGSYFVLILQLFFLK